MKEDNTKLKGENIQEKSKVTEKYALLDEGLDVLSSGKIHLIVLKGQAGIGKSKSTINYLDKKKISNAYVSAYSTPLSFYELLYKHKDKKVIVIDDLEGLGDMKIIAMLKSACWENKGKQRIVSYFSTSEILEKKQLPESFILNANLVLIFNQVPAHFQPILDRGIVLDFSFSFDEKLKIFDRFKEEAGIDEEVLDYIKNSYSKTAQNISFRTLITLSEFKRARKNYKELAKEMIEIDTDLELLCVKLQNCTTLQNIQGAWCKETGLSERCFYNYYKKFGGKKYFKKQKKRIKKK